MKKILLFTDNYDPKGGGAEKVFFQLIEDLQKNKKLKVYSAGFGYKEKISKKYQIFKQTNNIIIRHLNRLFFNPIMYFKLKNYFKKINPDVIHLHNINKYTISLLKACEGFKVVMTVHDYGLVCPTQWNVHNDLSPCKTGFTKKCFWEHKRDWNILIYFSQIFFFNKRNKLLKKLVSKYTTSTPILKKYLELSNFQNILVVPDPIKFDFKVKPNFSKIKKNTFLYASFLDYNKGPDIAIEAFSLAFRKNKHIYLDIVGDGPLKNDLIKLVKSKNLEKNIFFLGRIDLKNIYQNYLALILPSIWTDNNPIIVQEMMYFYRPVIGSNRGGMLYTIKDNFTGYILNPILVNTIAKKIIILTNINKVKKMGLESNKRILKLQNESNHFEDLY